MTLSVLGRSFLKAATGPVVFSQSGALLAVMIRARDKKLKALAGSTFIASLFGITEPGVYGITLKLKRPFICAVCAAALGGAVVGYARSSAMSMGMTSLLTVPIFYGDGFMGFVLGCVVAFIASLLLTLMVGFDEAGHLASAAAPTAPTGPVAMGAPVPDVPVGTTLDLAGEQIGMPIKGELIALSLVNDKVFSSGVVGKGIAILPAEGRVYAPMDGRVMHTFTSGHALGLQSDSGAEILIHV